jgi:anti-sigma factor RsiW
LMEYAEGLADAELSTRVGTHLSACTACAEAVSEFREWQEMMRAEGLRLQGALATSDQKIESMLAESLIRISSKPGAGPYPLWTTRQALLLLRSLLEPLCGFGAARAAIDLALRRSAPLDAADSTRNWRLFIANLSENVESICGSATARLVGCAGLSLELKQS